MKVPGQRKPAEKEKSMAKLMYLQSLFLQL